MSSTLLTTTQMDRSEQGIAVSHTNVEAREIFLTNSRPNGGGGGYGYAQNLVFEDFKLINVQKAFTSKHHLLVPISIQS